MTRTFYADLHVHTVHSACAEVEMIPPLIVRRALALGLGMLAITDHNASANCAAVIQAAAGTGLTVLPGMEVQTAEDVHVICLFDTVEQALTWQGTVFDHLPVRENPEEMLGGQYVVDAAGDYVRTEGRLLATGVDLPIEEVVRRVTALGGAAIPAHINRPSYSLLANLGFVPPDLQAPALEIFNRSDPAELLQRQPQLAGWAFIRSGDAHSLGEISRGILIDAEERTVAALVAALRGARGSVNLGPRRG